MVRNNIFTSLKEVIHIWRESLRLLINKQFWLVTLKASKESYLLLFRKFWWLIGICIVVDVLVRTPFIFQADSFEQSAPAYFDLFSSMPESVAPVVRFSIFALWFLLWTLIGFILFLIVRPSNYKKDSHYFLSQYRSYFYFVLVTLIGWFARDLIRLLLFKIDGEGFFIWNIFFITSPLLEINLSTLYFSPLLIIYSFFYLDSKKNIVTLIKRFWSALTMIVYTYPFCFIVWFAIFLLLAYVMVFTEFIIRFTLGLFLPIFIEIPEVLADDVTKLFLPLFLCLINNLYTKQVHDHYDLYS